VGELLQRRTEPLGIEYKLRTYSLVHDHEEGGPKADGFRQMLGIGLESIQYLEQEIRRGIAITPISLVKPGDSDGFRCTVNFLIAGPGRYSHRTVPLLTGWMVASPRARPVMSTAFLR
jgi:hypothetical protein